MDVNSYSFLWDNPHTEHNEPSTRRRHGLVPVGGFFMPSINFFDLEKSWLGQMVRNGLKQCFGLRQTARTGGLASLHPVIGRNYQPSVILQHPQIPLGRSLAPHGRIHAWCENARNGLRGDTGCSERDHIFRDPVSQSADGVHACWGDQEQLKSARDTNVLGVRGIGTLPGIAQHRTPRKGLKGRFPDESLGVGRHQHVHQSAALRQLADHMAHLVRGNAPGHANTDVSPLKGAGVSV